jgi:hypothetical protein
MPKESPKGLISSLFHILDEHPNAPDNLYRWVKLIVNFLIVSVFVYLGWSVVSTVKTDIANANQTARFEIMGRITECQNRFNENGCANQNRPPALNDMCNQWSECMTQNPEAIMRVKVTAKQIAEIINEFADAMNLKAWVSFPRDTRTIAQLIINRAFSSLYLSFVPLRITFSSAVMPTTSQRHLFRRNPQSHPAIQPWFQRTALDSCGFRYRHLG